MAGRDGEPEPEPERERKRHCRAAGAAEAEDAAEEEGADGDRVAMPLLQAVVATLRRSALAALGPAADAATGSHEGALKSIVRLAHDYETHLMAQLYGAVPLLTTTAQRVRPQPLPADEESRLRVQAAEHYLRKLTELMSGWIKHLHAHPAVTDGPAAAFFRPLAQRWPVLRWMLQHAQVHTETRLNVLQASLADVQAAGASVDETLAELAAWFARGGLSFPWKRLYLSRADADAMMARLRDFQPRTDEEPCAPHNIHFEARAEDGNLLFPQCYRGGYLNFRHLDADYSEMDVLVDLFQERPRLSARRQDQPASPLELWRRPEFVERVLRTALTTNGRLDAYSMREAVFALAKECTQFKPSLAVGILRWFGARRVLDFSAGWGDRLAGAIAANVERYRGFDPNPALRRGHEALKSRFLPAERHRDFTIAYEGFETVALPPETFDLVFTSPPFYDFEIYTSAPGQSVDRYRSLDAWLVEFLFACLDKASRALETGGHVVIHLTDVELTRVCEPMCLLLLWRLPHLHYLGVMCSHGRVQRPRPLWAFEKRADPAPASRQACAERELQRLYPGTWAAACAARGG